MAYLNCSETQAESQGQKLVSIMQSLVKAVMAFWLSLHSCLLQISAGPDPTFLPITYNHREASEV